MKKCTYCGKTYPDDTDTCAVDAHSLVPYVPPLSANGRYTLPIQIRPKENWTTFLKLKKKSAGLHIAVEGLTCYPGGFPVLIKWNEINELEQHSKTINLSQVEATIYIYRHDSRRDPIIVDVWGLELEPHIILSLLDTCRAQFSPNQLRATKSPDLSLWEFPIEFGRLHRFPGAWKIGAFLLAVQALVGLGNGWMGLLLSSPVGLMGLGCFVLQWWLRPRPGQPPKMRLTRDGVDYNRGKDSWSLKWEDVSRVYLDDVSRVHLCSTTPESARLYFFTHAAPKSKLTANVTSFELSPREIFEIIKRLRQSHALNSHRY